MSHGSKKFLSTDPEMLQFLPSLTKASCPYVVSTDIWFQRPQTALAVFRTAVSQLPEELHQLCWRPQSPAFPSAPNLAVCHWKVAQESRLAYLFILECSWGFSSKSIPCLLIPPFCTGISDFLKGNYLSSDRVKGEWYLEMRELSHWPTPDVPQKFVLKQLKGSLYTIKE